MRHFDTPASINALGMTKYYVAQVLILVLVLPLRCPLMELLSVGIHCATLIMTVGTTIAMIETPINFT